MQELEITHDYSNGTNEITERRLHVSRLRVQGWTFRDIASKLGVSPATVHSDMKAVRLYWKEQASQHYEDQVSQELGVLEAVEVEAWQAWKRSIGKAVTSTQKRKGKGDAQALERTTVEKDMVGDPRFLTLIKDVVQVRTELLANMKGDGVQRRTLAQFLQDARNGASVDFYERKVSVSTPKK